MDYLLKYFLIALLAVALTPTPLILALITIPLFAIEAIAGGTQQLRHSLYGAIRTVEVRAPCNSETFC